MNILFINTVDSKSGAAKVAYSLKTEMTRLGYNTSMFVKIKHSSDSDIFVINKPNCFLSLINKITGKDVSGYLNRKIHKLLATDIDFFNSDSKSLLKTFVPIATRPTLPGHRVSEV